VGGANTGQAAGNNLAPLGDELLQQTHIAVVDRVDLLHAELADLLAPEELPSARAARPTWTTPTRAASARTTGWTIWTVARGTIRTVAGGTIRTIAGWTIWTFGWRAV
jgi:hypothetical protein